MPDNAIDQRDAPKQAGFFGSTRWSLVLRAKNDSAAALDSLCATYRAPLLAFLRSSGYPHHDAEDLAQSFLANLLRKDFLQNVAREKGRFRTFLLVSLKHYLIDEQARKNALIRGGGQVPASLQDMNAQVPTGLAVASPGPSPDVEFDRAWAHEVLRQALRRLSEECTRLGQAALLAQVEPVLYQEESASPYQEIGRRLNMSEGAIKTTVHRIRARLKGLIRDEVMQTVSHESDWQEEVAYLVSLFSR